MSAALIVTLTTSIVAIVGAVFAGLAQYRHASNPSAHTPPDVPKP